MIEHTIECTKLKGAIEVLGDRWSALILWSLTDRPLRFVDLQKSTQGINSRTLTQRLQTLEEGGLITRREFREYPPRTEYSITEKGLELQPVFTAMMTWAQKHAFRTNINAE